MDGRHEGCREENAVFTGGFGRKEGSGDADSAGGLRILQEGEVGTQVPGFLRSLGGLLGSNLPIPDHTKLSRRLRRLGDITFRMPAQDRPIHLLIDSTGLRIHVGHLRKPTGRSEGGNKDPEQDDQPRDA
jgi:hypothetical protein